MVNQNWWFTTLLVNQHRYCPPLAKDIKCDVLIVGGGFSGVSAAAEFLRKGLSVVLIEKNIVGGSSSGRSAGFLTPDSELELHQLVRRYGTKAAAEIWEAPCKGIDRIVDSITKYDIKCGLLRQDSLFLGLGAGGKEAVDEELECRKSVGFTDQRTYDASALKEILGAEGYTAGIRYGGTYGVNPLQCLQGIKDLLVDNGMQVYESTAMERLEDHTAYTHGGSVTADHIVVAVDKLSRRDQPARRPGVPRADVPERDRAADRQGAAHPVPGRRADAMLGLEARVLVLQAHRRQPAAARGRQPDHHVPEGRVQQPAVIRRVIDDFRSHFPALRDLSFIQFWPGQIDATRDLLPVIARPPEHRTSASSSAAWAFPGRPSAAASPRATSSARPTRTTGSTSTTSRTSATSCSRAASAT